MIDSCRSRTCNSSRRSGPAHGPHDHHPGEVFLLFRRQVHLGSSLSGRPRLCHSAGLAAGFAAGFAAGLAAGFTAGLDFVPALPPPVASPALRPAGPSVVSVNSKAHTGTPSSSCTSIRPVSITRSFCSSAVRRKKSLKRRTSPLAFTVW